MREIKFRAWDKDNKKFRYYEFRGFLHNGDVIAFDEPESDSTYVDDYFSYNPKEHYSELQQFTDLLSKSGKEIYEGDIVKTYDCSAYFVVQWADVKAGWIAFNPHHTGYGMSKADAEMNLEVIGNIYENPELLDSGRHLDSTLGG